MITRKKSFAALFTGVCLVIMVGTAFALSFVVFINLRSLVYPQAETNIRESMHRLQERVSSLLNDQGILLKHTAAAVSCIHRTGEVPQQEPRDFFTGTIKTLPGVSYLVGNIKWSQGPRFIGVNRAVAADLFANDPDSTVKRAVTLPGQRMFLLNKAGLV